MPLIQITMVEGRTVEQKRDLARELTDTFARVAGAKPESVWVTFDEVPAENWATGGTLLADRG
jgi:4-oxalocrotonate tautomerase